MGGGGWDRSPVAQNRWTLALSEHSDFAPTKIYERRTEKGEALEMQGYHSKTSFATQPGHAPTTFPPVRARAADVRPYSRALMNAGVNADIQFERIER